MKLNHFANLQTLKIAAVSTLSLGAAATMCAAPAQAAVVTGGVGFNDGAINVIGTIPTAPGSGSFVVNFNNDGVLIAPAASKSGTLGALFPTSTKFVAPSSVGLSYLSGSNYVTTNDLVFDFGAATGKLTIATGAVFLDTPNLLGTRSAFNYLGTAATFMNGTDSTPLSLTSFNFNVDNLASTNPLNPSPDGSYSLVATVAAPAAAVPEPFTIIGTLIGGTAAIRTRKKLKAAAKV